MTVVLWSTEPTAGMPLSMPFEAPNTSENPPLNLMGAAGPASVGGWLQLREVRPPQFLQLNMGHAYSIGHYHIGHAEAIP